MLGIIFATIVLAAVRIDCGSFTITGPTWKNEISACATGGDHQHSYTFYLGKVTDYAVNFEEIRSAKTSVVAEGDLLLKTAKEGWIQRSTLNLWQSSESSEYKQFRGNWRMDSYRGWATQSVQMVLTIKFYDDDNIYLDTEVYAGSWWAFTCSETKAYVERIKVVF